MSKILIVGGNTLNGEIKVDGSKNSVLPIIAASVLNSGKSILKNCPKLKDVELSIQVLKNIGCKVTYEADNTLIIDSSTINTTMITEEYTSKMRSSILFMGSLVAKYKKVTISYPGG